MEVSTAELKLKKKQNPSFIKKIQTIKSHFEVGDKSQCSLFVTKQRLEENSFTDFNRTFLLSGINFRRFSTNELAKI